MNELTRMTGESMEPAVPKVLAKHGWVRTKGAGTRTEDRVYSQPNHPGHVIRVDGRGGWWHADANRKWAAVIAASQGAWGILNRAL